MIAVSRPLYLEKNCKEIAEDADFKKIIKDIGQPIISQNPAESAE